jgi:hypothetical protein
MAVSSDQVGKEHREISHIGSGTDHDISFPENRKVEALFGRAALEDFKRREIYSWRCGK